MTLLHPFPLMPFHCVAVIGAAGKMGAGISLLLLQEMALCHLHQLAEKNDSPPNIRLVLVDMSPQGLDGLREYLQTQILRFAEKNIILLREITANIPSLISNREIIEAFCSGAIEIVHLTTSIEEAKSAELIFEAIIEDIDRKVLLLSQLSKQSTVSPYFFSNTSSIPISVLNDQANLEGRIIGFHFYNPPAVQKLLEIIPLENGNSELKDLAITLATLLNKQIIFSKDVAGFIGNGYFLREIAFTSSIVQKLSSRHGLQASIYMVNRVTQEFLLRPMGIFQLIDYVGLDVIERIGDIMNAYLSAPFYNNDLMNPLLEVGKVGGQFSDGSQKDGFFHYTDQKITGIYDFEGKNDHYVSLEKAEWKIAADAWLGDPPEGFSWKSLANRSDSTQQIESYFKKLAEEKSEGAHLALEFLQNLHKISQQLVHEKIVSSQEDMDSVLKKGFFHLYGDEILKINLTSRLL